AAYDLDPVQLVAVNCRGQAEHRAGARVVEHDHGRGRCEGFDGGAAAPGQALGRARRDLTTEKPQLRFWLQPCGVSRQIGLSMRACDWARGGSGEKPTGRAVRAEAVWSFELAGSILDRRSSAFAARGVAVAAHASRSEGQRQCADTCRVDLFILRIGVDFRAIDQLDTDALVKLDREAFV